MAFKNFDVYFFTIQWFIQIKKPPLKDGFDYNLK